MRKIFLMLWAFALGICLLQAQSRLCYHGMKRATRTAGNYVATQQIGTLNNTVITGAGLKGLQSFPLDFDSVPYSTDTSLNYFEIGYIPDQTIQAGTLLHFYVKCDSLTGSNKTYSILPTDTPQGPLRFKSSLQYFHFEPHLADTLSFSVFFYADNGMDTISQEVHFRVYAQPSPENYFFALGTGQTLPNPTDIEYQLITTINLPPETFNGKPRLGGLRDISISAVDLYAENVPNNQLMSYSGNTDIKRLSIYAERLFIRDTLNLPQTEVNIFCNQLIFDGRPEAVINTTPKKMVQLQGPNNPGIKGHPGGNINVFARQIIDTIGGIRFRLVGGDGQDATDAQAGDGGDGGTLFSNLDLQYKGDYLAGLAGRNSGASGVAAEHYKGSSGDFELDSIRTRWIHPNYLRQILTYSDDAYYLGFQQAVLPKLVIYDQFIDVFKNSGESEVLDVYTASDLMQTQMELITMINRIISGLDYFGNPPGWVPMLSFEFTKAAFDSELENAMGILYLNYFITKAVDTLQNRVNGYQSLAAELQAQNALNEDIFSDLNQVSLPLIEARIDSNNMRMESIKNELQRIAAEIEARAQSMYESAYNAEIRRAKRDKWRAGMRFTGKVAAMIPDPWCNCIGVAVGTALQTGANVWEALDNANNDITLSTIKELAVIVEQGYEDYQFGIRGMEANQQKWDTIKQQWANFFPVFQGVDSINGIKNQVDRGSELFGSLHQVYKDVKSIYEELFAIPDPQLQKFTSDQLAIDPVFASMANELKEAQGRHSQLVMEYNSINEQILTLGSGIVASAIAFDDANTKASNNLSVLDHRAKHYIQYLKYNALRRLKKYQYYMAKAYEFRTLQPYTGNLNLLPILTSVVAI